MTKRVARPLWIIGVTWLSVCLALAWAPFRWLWWITGACAVITAAVLLIPSVRVLRAIPLVAIAALMACVSFLYAETVRFRPLAERVGEEVYVEARVSLNQGTPVLTVTGGELPVGARLLLRGEPAEAALANHDTVAATFVLEAAERRGMALRKAKAGDGYFVAYPVEEAVDSWVVTHGEAGWRERVVDWRDRLTERIQRASGGDEGAVLTGLCFGADEALSSVAETNFRTCGVSHLFAVSGLHLSILTQGLHLLLKQWRLPRTVRGGIVAAAIVFFCLFVGETPSVTRAASLCLLVVLGDCGRRKADARNSLGLALILLLLQNPFAAYDAGLLLSFSATFGLLFLSPVLNRQLQRAVRGMRLYTVWCSVAAPVSVTVAATVTTFPVTALYFGSFSVVGVVANLLMTVPAAVLLALGWVILPFLALGWSVLYYPILWCGSWLSRLLLWIAELCAKLPFAAVPVNEEYLFPWLCGSVLLGIVGCGLLYRRGAVIAVVCAAVILGVGAVCHAGTCRNTVTVYPLVTHGDTAVLIQGNGKTVLVTAPTEPSTLFAVRDALRDQGVTPSAVLIPYGDAYSCDNAVPFLCGFDSTVPTIRETTVIEGIGRATFMKESLSLTVYGTRLIFAPATEEVADCTFTQAGMTLFANGKHCTVREEAPALRIRQGEWLVKSC